MFLFSGAWVCLFTDMNTEYLVTEYVAFVIEYV